MAKANAKDKSIPKLSPGKATQTFLQPRAPKHAPAPAPADVDADAPRAERERV